MQGSPPEEATSAPGQVHEDNMGHREQRAALKNSTGKTGEPGTYRDLPVQTSLPESSSASQPPVSS